MPRPDKTPDSGDLLLADINTTPLVDVMLVLLIIFMVTIPAIVSSAPVRLPDRTAERLASPPGTPVITLTATGTVYWNREPVPLSGLAARLAGRGQDTPATGSVELRADADVPFERVKAILRLLDQAGIRRVSLVTGPIPPGPGARAIPSARIGNRP
ncbi:biopolymer transporter ExbD [Phaeovibrio sulfidiphilus]|uniref:Biopolymer transporter ExbD n=1 Tax=Phaeovibrio sulfidiphilus TaxID=1220600 RepID=A0A8J7CWD9_9PROT|nr:biopolymer transporter ExbD [Phaeovibrio sulfidiphilus]MBE1237366.1 biopolymer transporter ExbD [Phaeovibrio sulfidiphilus]